MPSPSLNSTPTGGLTHQFAPFLPPPRTSRPPPICPICPICPPPHVGTLKSLGPAAENGGSRTTLPHEEEVRVSDAPRVDEDTARDFGGALYRQRLWRGSPAVHWADRLGDCQPVVPSDAGDAGPPQGFAVAMGSAQREGGLFLSVAGATAAEARSGWTKRNPEVDNAATRGNQESTEALQRQNVILLLPHPTRVLQSVNIC